VKKDAKYWHYVQHIHCLKEEFRTRCKRKNTIFTTDPFNKNPLQLVLCRISRLFVERVSQWKYRPNWRGRSEGARPIVVGIQRDRWVWNPYTITMRLIVLTTSSGSSRMVTNSRSSGERSLPFKGWSLTHFQSGPQ